MEVYLKLIDRVDVTARVLSADAKAGVVVNIVPPHGKVLRGSRTSMTWRAGIATVVEGAWEPPSNRHLRRKKWARRKPSRLVEVSRVLAPSAIVPGISYFGDGDGENKRDASLGDFGDPPFRVELPLTMLGPHVEGDSSAVSAADVPTTAVCAEEETTTACWTVTEEDNLPVARDDSTGFVSDQTGAVSEAEGVYADPGLRCREDMNEDDIAALRELKAVAEARNTASEGPDVKLDKPPESIQDRSRAVLGDPFHYLLFS